MVGDLTDRAWHAHWQATARIHLARKHVGQTVATFFSWRKHLEQCVRSPSDGSKRMDAPTEHDDNKWLSGGGNGIDELLLHASEVEVGRVVTLSDRDRSQDATASGDHDHSYVGIPRHLHRFSKARLVIAQHFTAFGIADLDIIA